ncbi:MAG: 23S rRNA (uracil(1939)-C(5))-methyltransferase RlmD [Ignavibacteria bacterium]
MDNLKKEDIIELTIVDIGAEGIGLGRYNNEYVVFVPGTVPGDTVKAKIRKKKKKYAESQLFEVITPSPKRTEPECEYFGTCNGCKMQNIDYNYQLELKRQIVKNAFERIGGFEDIIIPEVLGSQDIYYYRNKLEFSFSNSRWLTKEDMDDENVERDFALGYHIPGFIDKIIDIRACYLQSLETNKILNLTRDFFKSRKTTVYSTKTHSGYLRFLTVRRSVANNDLMVNLITYEENADLINEYSELLKKEVPRVTTFVNSLTTSKAQVALADNFNVIYGKGFIEEKIGSYKFKITPNSFFQTNSRQCEKLFEQIVHFGDFSKTEKVLDLYCGCGAISLYISALVDKVHGVELSSESIEMANINSELNNVSNCEFEAKDVKDYLEELIKPGNKAAKRFDTFVLDPPRSGLHPKTAEYILEYAPEKIIYVSCNPGTQARDLAILKGSYEITKIQPVDMFPHTFHIENVVRLDLRPHSSLP